MTAKEILNRAAGKIEKNGLSYEKAFEKDALCTGSALVGASYEYITNKPGNAKFHDKEYTIARNLFCGLLGINSSYESIVQWNDDFRTEKNGRKVYKRTKEEVVRKLREAAVLSETVSKEK
jgi:hypothetical protein